MSPYPTYNQISFDDRHSSKGKYWSFLQEVWRGVAPLMARGATMICRLGATNLKQRELTVGLKHSVKTAFPKAELIKRPKVSLIGKRQTDNFLPGSKGCTFEVDYVFALN